MAEQRVDGGMLRGARRVKERAASRLFNYFFKGVVFLAPFALTIYVCVRVFTTIDGWLGIPIAGVGFLVTIVLITLFGYLAQGILTRSAFGVVERILDRLPFVRLLYSSTKDLLNAFVGEQRRFDKPVTVELFPGGAGPRDRLRHAAVARVDGAARSTSRYTCPSRTTSPASCSSSRASRRAAARRGQRGRDGVHRVGRGDGAARGPAGHRAARRASGRSAGVALGRRGALRRAPTARSPGGPGRRRTTACRARAPGAAPDPRPR